MTEPINKMSIKQFRTNGYLQEVNRRFLHPLGLALEVFVESDGTESLSGVWDYRDDPEGVTYGPLDDPNSQWKYATVEDAWRTRRPAREAALGYWIQPVTPT